MLDGVGAAGCSPPKARGPAEPARSTCLGGSTALPPARGGRCRLGRWATRCVVPWRIFSLALAQNWQNQKWAFRSPPGRSLWMWRGRYSDLDLLTTTEASSSAGRRKQPPRAAKTPRREREPRRKRAAVLPNRHGALAHTCRFGSTGGSLVCGDAGVCAPRGERSCPSEYSLISLSLV